MGRLVGTSRIPQISGKGSLQERKGDQRSTMKGRVIQASEFDSLLFDSVKEALTDVLGVKFTENFFTMLESELEMTKLAIPSKLDSFTSVLSTVFGHRAGLVIGRAIAKRFYARLEIPFVEKDSYTLLNYSSEAKFIMDQKGLIE